MVWPNASQESHAVHWWQKDAVWKRPVVARISWPFVAGPLA